MAGPNTILRIVAVPVVTLILMFVAWIGVTLFEPIDAALGTNAAGWTPVNFLFFMSLGLIGLFLVLIVWFWYAPIRNDVRQEQRQPPF